MLLRLDHGEGHGDLGSAFLIGLEALDGACRYGDGICFAFLKALKVDRYIGIISVDRGDRSPSAHGDTLAVGCSHLDVLVHLENHGKGRTLQARGAVRRVGGHQLRSRLGGLFHLSAASTGKEEKRKRKQNKKLPARNHG